MLFPIRLAILASTLTSTALANGIVQLTNDCSFDIYFALADQSGTSGVDQLTSGTYYTENQDLTPGRAIKLATNSSVLPDGSPVLQLEYTVSGGLIYYDISTVNGDPFLGQNVSLVPSDTSCATLGVGPEYQQSNGAGDVKACGDATNLVLTFCGAS